MRKVAAVLMLMFISFSLGVWWGSAPRPWFPLPVPPPALVRAIAVYDVDADALVSMPLEAYVTCVVAAEMPALYQLEALKAQAVAARTRAVAGTCAQHPEASVCTSSLCCQAFLSEQGQRDRWGADAAQYMEKMQRAAGETAGEILTYDGEPILVLYHAVSGGHTEDVELVYGTALPYLRGVESVGEEHASRYENVQTFTRAAFAKAVNAALPEAKLSADDLESLVAVQARSASGRVLGLRVGSTYMDGRALRKLLGLYSTQFDLTFDAENITITQLGYGHGVGMSQAGAEAMARAGATHMEILLHYYTDVQITHIDAQAGPE